MDITDEERQELIQDVINEITSQSTSIDELEEVTSLDNVTSLPVYVKDTLDLAKASVALLAKPATDAATTANAAASSASSAAAEASAAATAANTAKTSADTAAAAANTAAALAEQTKATIDSISTTANNADTASKNNAAALGGLSLVKTTEQKYSELEEKVSTTLYFCTEEDETESETETT